MASDTTTNAIDTTTDVILLCIERGGKFIPITGEPLHHETFISNMIIKNNNVLTAYQTLLFAAAIQRKYNICDGPPDIIQHKMENYFEHIQTLDQGIREELDLSRKRNLLSILVSKVSSNNEQGSS